MEDTRIISALVNGGEATAGPPLGPTLGPIGVNILQVVNTINEKTKDFPGMKVPVKIEVDTVTKKFSIEVGIPPTAALILKEAGAPKGSGTAGSNYSGSISLESAMKIARMKIDNSYASNLLGAVKEVIGTCLSIGMKIEDKPAKELYIGIANGMYDRLLR